MDSNLTSPGSGSSLAATTPSSANNAAIVGRFRQLLDDQKLTDFTVSTSDGADFQVHKAFLAANSDYFYAMLTVDMVESQKKQVELKSLTSKVFRPVLDHIYGKPTQLTQTNVAEILNAAVQLQVASLIETCTQYLLQNLVLSNSVDILHLTKLYNLESLKADVDQFIVRNIDKFLKENIYIDMKGEDMVALFGNNDLINIGEYRLYQAACKWLEINSKEKSVWARKIMKCIQFPLISKSELQVIKTNIPTDDCEDLIKEGEDWYELPPNMHVITKHVHRRIRSREKLVTFYEHEDLDEDLHTDVCMLSCEVKNEKWTQAKMPPDFVPFGRNVSLVVLNNYMIKCGDSKDNEGIVSSNCEVLDPAQLTWSKLAPMNIGRMWFPLIANEEKLYALGGCILNSPPFNHTNSVEKYSFKDNTWTQFAELAEKVRKASACLVSGGLIYISGGVNEHHFILKKMHMLDCHTGTMTEKQDMLAVHFGHTMINVDHLIFVIDTTNTANRLDYYNIITDQWTYRPIINQPRLPNLSFVATWGDHTYILGGVNRNNDREDQKLTFFTGAIKHVTNWPVMYRHPAVENTHIMSAVLTINPETGMQYPRAEEGENYV